MCIVQPFNSCQFLFVHIFMQQNCESECETRAMLAHCHCIMYYMPRIHSNITICSYSDYECAKKVERELLIKRDPRFKCEQCLSGCFAINYENTFSTAKLFDKSPYFAHNKIDPNNVAFLHIYYARSTFRSQTKEELVGFTDFLCKLHKIRNDILINKSI